MWFWSYGFWLLGCESPPRRPELRAKVVGGEDGKNADDDEEIAEGETGDDGGAQHRRGGGPAGLAAGSSESRLRGDPKRTGGVRVLARQSVWSCLAEGQSCCVRGHAASVEKVEETRMDFGDSREPS